MIQLLGAAGSVLTGSGLPTPTFWAYVLAFGLAAVVCFAAIPRARAINAADDTRNGLVALVAVSGVWAALQLGYLAAPTPSLQYGFYIAGLVVGLSTVGPWLYFCSAYTGRSLHNNPTYQRIAIAVYLLIVAIKITNPIHGLYFTATPATTPFTHLMIDHGTLHWLAMGLAYSLATVGIFMLFELFAQVDYDTRPFVGLVGLTALPVALDILGSVSPSVIDMSYSALGVAAFAVGVLFVYTDRFETIQLAGQYDSPVVVLGDSDEIRDYNRRAAELFPALEDGLGEELAAVVPTLSQCPDTEAVIELEIDGETRYFQSTTNPFSASRVQLGRLLVLTDVTAQERYRRELEAQNERLEQFTGMVSHDLRNPLNVAQGNSEIIAELIAAAETDDGEYTSLNAETMGTLSNAADTLSRTLARMELLIDDLLVLAREGQEIDEPEPVSLAAIVESCWAMVDQKAATLVVDDDPTVEADPDRLQQLLENLFRNAIEHGGSDVTIRVGELDDSGFYVEDDGPGIPADTREDVFESGYTTNREGTGFGLNIVSEIVAAHGWEIAVTDGEDGGARFEITGVDAAEGEPVD
ncbi:sensor histidine kinase [Halonotius roseus]|uniref:histidine kinase n=1 Tax=Halonotius roseus TaxID=2511997 RepID=A0A544QRL8_9EURY|nr:ATP-binding protein [Halonotius roseus]TQQ82091.1 histidine kinase [Halonotius roseus]